MRLCVLITLVAACVACFAAVASAEDTISRVVAVGDVHGDLPQLQAVLQMAELVDEEGKWIAHLHPTFVRDDGSAGRYKSVTLVQLGDMLDRGPHDKAVMDYMMTLREQVAQFNREAEQAAAQDDTTPPFRSEVVNLLGNHELMNLLSQFHYVNAESHEDFGGKQSRKRAFDLKGVYGKWLRSLPVVHVEGSTLFVHAGLSPSLARHGVAKLNEEAWRLLHDAKLSAQDLSNSPVFSVHGPLWTRKLITDATNGHCDAVHETLRTLNLQRMVVGHTPQRSGRIEAYCDDSLLAVDVGLSKWMYGKLAALEITEDERTGNVELREILAKPLSKSAAAAKQQEEEQPNEGTSEDSLEDAAIKDPTFLSEILEALQEANKKDISDEL